ncbi:transporter/permease protein [Cardiosporidium cionae]|uniref:Transporter/permease protein n=1 Tax=Cardiosporidium cionae TaxID=476202 RepID=A0ABQ7JBB2_9APIC|nr:transporter/permease protein [Cardiosporidium cionae]|eukprot:KAF8821293.1 transporter/permease protein [Cardiosporidium cionae]
MARRRKENWRRVGFLTFCDLAHQLIEKIGLIYAGSGVYTIAASSSTVWIAALSFMLLHRKISFYKWVGVLSICFGLSLKAFQFSISQGENEIVGALLTVFAAFLHGLSFVINEAFMTGDDPIAGPNLVLMTGMISSALLSIWTAVWTIPRWDTLFNKNIAAAGGSSTVAVTCFFLLLLCSYVRSTILWYLIKHMGAVSSSILKGIRNPAVFFLSHIFFCHLEKSQCLSVLKSVAAIVCASGVMIYSFSPISKEESIKQKAFDRNDDLLIENGMSKCKE